MSLHIPSAILGGAATVGLLFALRGWGVRTMQIDMSRQIFLARQLADKHADKIAAEALALEAARAPHLQRMSADVMATWAEAPCIPESHWRN